MQIDTFRRIVTTFSDPQTALLWEKEKLLVQVYGELIEASLRQRSGEVYVVDGGNEVPAVQWVLTRLARLPLLAARLTSTLPTTRPFITSEAEVLASLEVMPGAEAKHVPDALAATRQALEARSPLETTVLYITSDAGEGKTCLINELARTQAERFMQRLSDWVLVPIPLGGRHFLRFDDIVIGALVNRYRFPYFYYTAFLELVRLGVVIPAFDGFEEMFVENTSGEALSAMGILVNSMQSCGGVVIAARKAYFEFENIRTQARLYDTIRGFSVGFAKVSLKRWKKPQFTDYCVARNLSNANQLYQRVVERIVPEHPLVTRPVLVRRLVDIAERSSSLDDFLTSLQTSGANFFAVFVRGIIEREANEKWLDRSGEVAQPLLTIEEHCRLLSLIALEMWQSRVDFLKAETLEFVTDYFSETTRKSALLAAQIRERIKGHALLVASSNVQGAIEFDHDEFEQHFLGEAISEMCSAPATSVRSDLLNTLRKGVLPAHALNALVTALRRHNPSRQREIAALISEVAALDAQMSFTHENCSSVVLALLSGLEGGALTLKRMAFPAHSLRDKKLRRVNFEGCFFAHSSLENAELIQCRFTQCHFAKLDVHRSTQFHEVVMVESTFDAISAKDGTLTLYDPSGCRGELAQRGVSFPQAPLQLLLEPTRPRQPDDAVIQFGKVLRTFLRSTHISESLIHMKLGGSANWFINDCVPALLHRGVLVEIENRGGGQQRRFKLGRPMETLNEALERSGGVFSQFLDNATSPRAPQ
jgi:hypothetical protein